MNKMENANQNHAPKLRKNTSNSPSILPKYDIPHLIGQLKAKNNIPKDHLLALIKRATTLLSKN